MGDVAVFPFPECFKRSGKCMCIHVCEELHFLCCANNLDLLSDTWASKQAMKT